MDLTDIPFELRKNTNLLYMLNIEDHFSKFCKIYLLENKSQKGIVESLKDFMKESGEPKEIGSDNDREFINKSIISLLNSKSIKMINGRSYNPHSQGAVERAHKTIRNLLFCNFLEDIKNFILENSIKKVKVAHNLMNK